MANIKKCFFSLVIVSSCFAGIASAQDTLPKGDWSIAINPLNTALGDASIFVEHMYNDKHAWGGSLGWIFNVIRYGALGSGSGIQNNDDLLPAFLYNGVVARVYQKRYKSDKEHYISTVMFYKYLYYKHWDLADRTEGGDGEDIEFYNRSEWTNVLGAQILYGHERRRKKVYIDSYVGFGARAKLRHHFTYTCELYGRNICDTHSVGPRTRFQFWPTVHIGFRLSWRTKKGKIDK